MTKLSDEMAGRFFTPKERAREPIFNWPQSVREPYSRNGVYHRGWTREDTKMVLHLALGAVGFLVLLLLFGNIFLR